MRSHDLNPLCVALALDEPGPGRAACSENKCVGILGMRRLVAALSVFMQRVGGGVRPLCMEHWWPVFPHGRRPSTEGSPSQRGTRHGTAFRTDGELHTDHVSPSPPPRSIGYRRPHAARAARPSHIRPSYLEHRAAATVVSWTAERLRTTIRSSRRSRRWPASPPKWLFALDPPIRMHICLMR